MRNHLIDPRLYPKLPDYMEIITEVIPEGWRGVVFDIDPDTGAKSVFVIAECDTRAQAIYYASTQAIWQDQRG